MGYNKKSQKGFTIIEVSLVLAIGALIFLVVFLAVPAMQRSSRNDARKRDISSVATAISEYTANNAKSTLPTGTNEPGATLEKYGLKRSNQTSTITSGDPADPTKTNSNVKGDTIYIKSGAKCDGLNNYTIKNVSSRQFAVVGYIELASGFQMYCQDAS